ncbi:hypothetical protein V8F06_002935 [Rhypophila decipiens]
MEAWLAGCLSLWAGMCTPDLLSAYQTPHTDLDSDWSRGRFMSPLPWNIMSRSLSCTPNWADYMPGTYPRYVSSMPLSSVSSAVHYARYSQRKSTSYIHLTSICVCHRPEVLVSLDCLLPSPWAWSGFAQLGDSQVNSQIFQDRNGYQT